MKGKDVKVVGIEQLNVYGGSAYLNVAELAKVRGLDNDRFENLLMKENHFWIQENQF